MLLCQVAISTTHLKRTLWWYEKVFGFARSGNLFELDNDNAPASGLPESHSRGQWMLDKRNWFQFEFFEFLRPRMRPIPADWRPSDIGYSKILLHVDDFDETLRRIARFGGRPLTEPAGARGRRRVCLPDPDGIMLEIMEQPVWRAEPPKPKRPQIPTTARGVTLSVAWLDQSARFWTEAAGCAEAAMRLHEPEDERLWGLEGAEAQTRVLWSGDFLIELKQYLRPPGRPRPAGYLPSDQGILNVALGSTDQREFNAAVERIRAAGYRPNKEFLTVPGVATVVYFTDEQGFSLELMHVQPHALAAMGFVLPGE